MHPLPLAFFGPYPWLAAYGAWLKWKQIRRAR